MPRSIVRARSRSGAIAEILVRKTSVPSGRYTRRHIGRETQAADRGPPIDILVMSAARAAAYEPSRHEVCISIGDPNSEPVPLSGKFAGVLRLSFSDIAAPSPFQSHKLFAAEHARAIIEFVDRWCDVDRIVVHCLAGLSRSPAVALAIAELRGMRTADLERSKRPASCDRAPAGARRADRLFRCRASESRRRHAGRRAWAARGEAAPSCRGGPTTAAA